MFSLEQSRSDHRTNDFGQTLCLIDELGCQEVAGVVKQSKYLCDHALGEQTGDRTKQALSILYGVSPCFSYFLKRLPRTVPDHLMLPTLKMKAPEVILCGMLRSCTSVLPHILCFIVGICYNAPAL